MTAIFYTLVTDDEGNATKVELGRVKVDARGVEISPMEFEDWLNSIEPRYGVRVDRSISKEQLRFLPKVFNGTYQFVELTDDSGGE